MKDTLLPIKIIQSVTSNACALDRTTYLSIILKFKYLNPQDPTYIEIRK